MKELIIAIKPFHDTHCVKSVQIRSNLLTYLLTNQVTYILLFVLSLQ